MADRPRFGPAGIPVRFKELNAPTRELPRFLQREGLDALEYEAVRWGQHPQMKRAEAEKLGENAVKHDVWLSLHGSYYINLLSSKKIREASVRRLLACATAAEWMQAHTIVFHPGYYSQRQSHAQDLQDCITTLNTVVDTMHSMSISAMLGPETSGKLAALGSLDETLAICESVDQTQPVIDWAHLHARQRGTLGTATAFQQVVETIENRLGSRAAKHLHCHFSLVEYTYRGERRHHPLNTPGYGPPFERLADVIASLGLSPVIISETPLLDEDAQRMRDIVYQKLDSLPVQR
jgi:deoxyribonuclease-4